MEKQSFSEYGMSNYASQVLQRYRHYVTCEYNLSQGSGVCTLKVNKAKGSFSVTDDTWDGVAYQMNEHMRESGFKKLMNDRNNVEVTEREDHNPFKPSYPVF